MESEKVKEIKKALEKVTEKHCTTYLRNGKNCNGCENIELNYCDKRLAILTLTLIKELESENAELKKYKLDWLNGEKMHLQAELEETEFELASSNSLFEIVNKENKQLKNRIAKLEQDLGQCENGYKLELHTARYQMQSTNEDLEKAKDRIAELEKENAKLLDSVETVQSNRCTTKCELTKKALKQFAEMLKEKLGSVDLIRGWTVKIFIDETLKEMINEKKNP